MPVLVVGMDVQLWWGERLGVMLGVAGEPPSCAHAAFGAGGGFAVRPFTTLLFWPKES